jgi:hypothetical protein
MAHGVALTGNLELGRVKISGVDYLTVRIEPKAPSKLLYTFLKTGSEYEVMFADNTDNLEGRDPEMCLILEPTLELGDGFRFGESIVLVQSGPAKGEFLPNSHPCVDVEYHFTCGHKETRSYPDSLPGLLWTEDRGYEFWDKESCRSCTQMRVDEERKELDQIIES